MIDDVVQHSRHCENSTVQYRGRETQACRAGVAPSAAAPLTNHCVSRSQLPRAQRVGKFWHSEAPLRRRMPLSHWLPELKSPLQLESGSKIIIEVGPAQNILPAINYVRCPVFAPSTPVYYTCPFPTRSPGLADSRAGRHVILISHTVFSPPRRHLPDFLPASRQYLLYRGFLLRLPCHATLHSPDHHPPMIHRGARN